MLIPVIKFEIHDFANNFQKEFVIANTPENQEKVFAHHHTRDIHFESEIDFVFEKKTEMPAEFINWQIWAAIVSENPEFADEEIIWA